MELGNPTQTATSPQPGVETPLAAETPLATGDKLVIFFFLIGVVLFGTISFTELIGSFFR
jgi:hypothetical protein